MKTNDDKTLTEKNYPTPILLASMLAFVAGQVNSIGLIAFSGFVSHVSGHATRSAMEYSAGNHHLALIFALEIVYFFSGTVTTTFLLHGKNARNKNVSPIKPLGLEIIIIGAIGVMTHISATDLEPLSKKLTAFALHGLSFAMGLQNAMLRKTAVGIIRTTHMTGIVTDLGIAFGSILHKTHVYARTEFQRAPTLWSIWDRVIDSAWEGCRFLVKHVLRETFALHMALLLSFACGAVTGTYAFLSFDYSSLFFPCSVLFMIFFKEILTRIN